MTDAITGPDLYEDDFYAWCMGQAAALRRRERGVNGLDYDNLAEELRGLAKTDFRACQSFVTLIIQHLVLLAMQPGSQDAPHWRLEVATFRGDIEDYLTDSLAPKIRRRLPRLRAKAVRELQRKRYPLDFAEARRVADSLSWEQIMDEDWWPERPTPE